MARTIAEIKKTITDAWLSDEALCDLYGNRWRTDGTARWDAVFSKVSLENLMAYVVASAHHVFEVLMDAHMSDVQETISHRAHTLTWYRDKALAFQFGFPLSEDYAEYDNTGIKDSEVEESRIVKKCSCETLNTVYPTILVKAGKEAGVLEGEELEAFTRYMEEVSDAGVKVTVRSELPDRIALRMKIWYDPLVVSSEGLLLDRAESSTVGKTAVGRYLGDLKYNGALYVGHLEQAIMQQRGVKMCRIEGGKATFGGGSVAYVSDVYHPYSGAMAYDEADDGEYYVTEYINFEDTFKAEENA